MAYQTPAGGGFVNTDIKIAITEIGLGREAQANGVAGDIANEDQARLVADFLTISHDAQGREGIFHKSTANRAYIAGWGDMAGPVTMNSPYDLGVKADTGNGHEMAVVGLAQVEFPKQTAFQALKGGLEGAVEAQFAGQEVFGTAGDDEDWHFGPGGGVGDTSNGTISAGDYQSGGPGLDGLAG